MDTGVDAEKSLLYELLKSVGILFVVLAHVTRMYTGYGAFTTVYGMVPFYKDLTKIIYFFHMPLFIFASGAVFSYCIAHGKYKSIPVFLKKKVFRLLIPYFVWGAVLVTPVMIFCRLTEKNWPDFYFNGIVLSLDSRHLWFLLALWWIFIAAIFIKNLKAPFVLLLSVAMLLVSNYATPLFQIKFALYYQLYFFLGYLFDMYYEKVLAVLKKFFFILLPVIIAAGILLYRPQLFWSDILLALAGITGAVVCTAFVISSCGKVAHSRILKRISNAGFGIYIFHPMMIYLIFFWIQNKRISPTFVAITVSAAVTVFSLILSELLKKVPVIKNLL